MLKKPLPVIFPEHSVTAKVPKREPLVIADIGFKPQCIALRRLKKHTVAIAICSVPRLPGALSFYLMG